MADVTQNVADIRAAILGLDVRASIANGIEGINTEVVSTTARQDLIDINETIRIDSEIARVDAEVIRETTTDAIKTAYDLATKENTVVELTNARKGEVNLETKIDKIDTNIQNNVASLAETVTKGELFLNVKDYGAIGDGIVDDTIAIQNANDMAIDGEIIYFPKGRYIITSVLNIKPNIKLVGAGRKSSILVGTVASMTMVQLIQSTLTRTYNEITTLGFEASADNVTAIKSTLSSALLFENLYFGGLLYNFNLDRGSNFQIKNILIEGTATRSAGKSIFQDTTKTSYIFDLNISDYQIRNIGNGVQTPSIEFNRSVGSFLTNYHVNDLGAASGILYSGDCQGCKIATSIIVKPSSYAIKYILEGAVYPIAMTITDVDIDQATLNGIQIDAGFWYTIIGGNITSIGQHGIVVGTDNVTIQNTKIINCFNQGIQINANVKNFILTGNHIEQTENAILISSGTSDNYIIQNNNLMVSNTSKIIDNGTGVNKLIANNLGINTSYKKEYSISTVLTLVGGATTETIIINIPVGLFPAKAEIGFMMEAQPTQYLIGYYLHDDVSNNSTTAYFEIARRDGATITAGGTRFNILLKS